MVARSAIESFISLSLITPFQWFMWGALRSKNRWMDGSASNGLSLRFIPRKPFVAFGIIAESATNPFNLAADLNGLFLDLGGEVGSVSLGFDRTQDGLLISWPTETTGLKLHRTDSLSQPNWVPVAGVVDQAVTVLPGRCHGFLSATLRACATEGSSSGCRKTYWCRA